MEDSRRSSAPIVVSATLLFTLALPVLYILSVGPASWLVEHGYLDRESAIAFYSPIRYAVQHSSTVQAAMNWYLSWFY
jgi:hypothetical protein